MRAARHILIGLIVVVNGGPSAWATIDNLKSYKAAYPGKDAKAYSCKICHTGAIGKQGNLNAYGQTLQQLRVPVDAKKLTAENYKAIEQDDADSDGATNLQEWSAGTDLADPASVPPGITAPAPAPAQESPSVPKSSEQPSSDLSTWWERPLATLDERMTTPVFADYGHASGNPRDPPVVSAPTPPPCSTRTASAAIRPRGSCSSYGCRLTFPYAYPYLAVQQEGRRCRVVAA